MKMQAATTLLCGLLTASVAAAQEFITDGPFSLHVKGHDANSSIDGILTARSSDFAYVSLQYDESALPRLDNASHRFYYNYSQDVGVGFLVTDIMEGEVNDFGNVGKAMSLQYSLATNVVLPVHGNGQAALSGFLASSGFDERNRTYLVYAYEDGGIEAGGESPGFEERFAYNWAVCWQAYADVFAPVLSWITAGKPHNPTCELVDLVKTSFQRAEPMDG
ncbi:hypothetical protein F4808DRAFT_472984 [Astrocystis sublimbata]|nr:hypothetical protein F4808DRAFT_472984 [Astrocystis sublimbata]